MQRNVHLIPYSESLPSPRVSLPPHTAQAGPYRTSKLRWLPAGTPEKRASPSFLRHGVGGGGGLGGVGDNRDGGWGRWRWPLGLRQPLHPAAQTAEMEISEGSGGRELGRRGRGGRQCRGGRSRSTRTGRGEMGWSCRVGEFVERDCWGGWRELAEERAGAEVGVWGREPGPRRVSGSPGTGAVGRGGGQPFLALRQLPPSPDVFAQTCPLPLASSRGAQWETQPWFNRAKR